MSIITSVIVSYVSGLLTIFTPWSVKKLWDYRIKILPLGRFWKPLFKPGLSIITPTEEKDPAIKTQAFDFLSISLAEEEFNRMGMGAYERHMCDKISSDTLKKNLLLVGGPAANSVSKEVLDKAEVRYGFKAGNHNIIDKMNSDFVRKAEIEEGVVVRDYGIITKCINPFNRERQAIIVSGYYGWGTWGALKGLLDPGNLKYLHKEQARYFQILVSVDIYEKVPMEPVLLKDTFEPIRG